MGAENGFKGRARRRNLTFPVCSLINPRAQAPCFMKQAEMSARQMAGSEQTPEMPDLDDPDLIRNRRIFLNFLTRRVGNPADEEDVLQT
jgi:hypothetical protein